jgi:hypothetical protein
MSKMAQIVLLDRYGARRSMHACLPLLRSRAARSDEGKARMQARATWEAAIGSSGAGTRELIGRSGGPRIRRVALAVARSGSRWTHLVWKMTHLVTPLHLPRRGSGIKCYVHVRAPIPGVPTKVLVLVVFYA